MQEIEHIGLGSTIKAIVEATEATRQAAIDFYRWLFGIKPELAQGYTLSDEEHSAFGGFITRIFSHDAPEHGSAGWKLGQRLVNDNGRSGHIVVQTIGVGRRSASGFRLCAAYA